MAASFGIFQIAEVLGFSMKKSRFKNFNNSTANESYEIIETSEGDLVFAGYSGTQHGFYKWFIVKTDSDGNQIWSKAKNSVGDAILYGISESPNGGYVAAGFCNSWRSNLVTKRNPNNGNSTFTECIIGEVNVAGVYDITPAIGGGYYIIDERNNLTKIDEEGQVVYQPKTPNIQYDEFPLVAVTDVFNWGFKGLNFHWGNVRQYTWQEVIGNLHIVNSTEVESLRTIPFAKFRINR